MISKTNKIILSIGIALSVALPIAVYFTKLNALSLLILPAWFLYSIHRLMKQTRHFARKSNG